MIKRFNIRKKLKLPVKLEKMAGLSKAVNTVAVVVMVLLLAVFGARLAEISAAEGERSEVYAAGGKVKTGYTVVLDAGHGGPDGGAVGAKTGVKEAGLNLAVTFLVRDALVERGVNVVLTRGSGEALGDTKRKDMAQRKRIMNDAEADAVVSMHMNKFKDTSISGPMAFFMKGFEGKEAQKLATSVIESVCAALGRAKRPANPADYFVIRECTSPGVLVECGFLSNSEDEALLADSEHQKKLALGIAEGVMNYLNSRQTQPASSPTDSTFTDAAPADAANTNTDAA